MNEKKRIFVENQILDMLNIDDETAGLILEDVPRIRSKETRKRLHDPFSSMEISKSEVLNELKNLFNSGYVVCVHDDGKKPYEGRFEDIPTERDNYDIWFRITDKGKAKFEEFVDVIWKD
jgi:hypothetical protein